MSVIRVLLADDHALMRAGLRALIREMRGVEVVGEAEDGAEALRLMGELRPDVALVDISMPRLNGLEVTARASAEHPRIRVVILSMHAFEEYVHRALVAGAAGYLLKDAEKGELEQALNTVARGQTWLSPAISGTVVEALSRGERPRGPFDVLSPRQREILQLIAEGRTTKEIAQQLELSVKTVETTPPAGSDRRRNGTTNRWKSHTSVLLQRASARSGRPSLLESLIDEKHKRDCSQRRSVKHPRTPGICPDASQGSTASTDASSDSGGR